MSDDEPDRLEEHRMKPSMLLDPRYHWLMDAARRIYTQLDPGERPVGLTLLSGSAEGEMLTTHVMDDQLELVRMVIRDESASLRLGEQFAELAVRLSPDETDLIQ